MSQLAIILLAAAAALSAVEFIGGPLRARDLINRYAVKRWLLKGLRPWPVARTVNRFRHWASKTFRPGAALSTAWCEVNVGVMRITNGSSPSPGSARHKFDADLIALATGGDPGAFYRLEADQLAAQVSAAAEAALNSPKPNATLLVALARLRKTELESSVPGEAMLGDYLRQEQITFETKTPLQAAFVAARRDLTSRIQRRLDELQIKTRSAQDIGDHVGFVVIATAIVLGVDPDSRSSFSDPLTWFVRSSAEPLPWFVLGLVAGFISPLMRRVVRALGR